MNFYKRSPLNKLNQHSNLLVFDVTLQRMFKLSLIKNASYVHNVNKRINRFSLNSRQLQNLYKTLDMIEELRF